MLILYSMSRSTSWNPESYAKNARFVSDLGEPLLKLLNPTPGELILDLGCGDGALTEKIAAFGNVVIGVDTSLAQLQAAQERRLSVAVINGEELALKRRFAAVFTNAALHWMKQPEMVVQGVANCLKPGGRFVGEFGGKGNVETIRAALHAGLRRRGINPTQVDPWYYPSADEYAHLLEQFGFAVEYIELIPRPTKLPGDILAWLGMFAQLFTNSLSEAKRESFLGEMRSELEPTLMNAAGHWFADYVR